MTIGVTPYGGADWWYETYGKPQQQAAASQSNQLAAMYQRMTEEAKKANLAREKEIRGTYADILGRLGPGGAFEKSQLADIQSQAEGLVGKETQGLISSGLYGTTTAASVPTRVETEFARPARMKLEDLLEQRRTEAKLGQAGFVERINQPYPDYNALMQAMVAQGTR